MRSFQHYKGGIYEFICTATHSETEEKLVIYKDEKGDVFARPYNMFFEMIEINNEKIPRFKELVSE